MQRTLYGFGEAGKGATILALGEQSIVRLTESLDVKARLWRLPVDVGPLGISLGHVLVHRHARSTLPDLRESLRVVELKPRSFYIS
jgi:hypothetical protein